MTEEVKITVPEGTEADKGTESQQSEPQYTETEQEAMKNGWRPEAEFDASKGKKWKSAEQFMELKPLFDKIDEQHKEIKSTKRALQDFGRHYERVEKAAYDRAIKELQAAKRTALEEGDLVKADEISEEIIEKRVEQQKVKAVEVPQTDNSAALASWKQRNEWYQADEDMTVFADGLGNKLLAQGKDPTDILVEVERKTKVAFPHKFRNPNRDSAPRVEGGSNKKSNSRGADFMSAEETRIMESLLKSGAPITREDFIKDLKKAKGL